MRFEVGQRVRIADNDHPWHGHHGTIERFPVLGPKSLLTNDPKDPWAVVQLEGAYYPSVGANISQLEVL